MARSRRITSMYITPSRYLRSATSTPDLTKDFAVLCPNCHAIAHRRKPALSVEEVRAAYKVGDGGERT